MKIIIDAMGGDLAPLEPIKGGLQARREFGVELVFTGRQDDIMAALKKEGFTEVPEGVEIVHCSEVIDNCDEAAMAWRHKPDSSLTVGLKLLKEGKGDAFLSAGSTGALLSGATLMVKRVPGVRRAAVAPTIPTGQGHAVLIDAGANAECTPEQMVQFAIMGSYYAELSLGIENPRVGLLNIGSEPSKGTELYQQVHKLLSQLGQEGKLNFVGNIEGREAVAGEADVLVADGFTGNIFLKTIEGTASWFNQEIKNILLRTTLTKLAALTLKDGIAAFKRKCDYREIGGTALLGIAKPVIKAHGSSDAFAFRSAVKQAIAYAQGNVTEKIAAQLAEPAAQEKEKEVK
jgi:phosphate acyltransferase